MSTNRIEQTGKEHHPILVRELGPNHSERLLNHFLALAPEDRTLRFGHQASDMVVENYVKSIDFQRDSIFGVFDEHLQLVGVGHLAYLVGENDGRIAEFGVSVSASARGLGVGSALFQRAAIHSRNTRVRTLYMHCLSQNAAMMHIARKAGMEVHNAYGEADAYLKLPPADTTSFMTEALQQQIAHFDYALRRNAHNAKKLAEHFWGELTATHRRA